MRTRSTRDPAVKARAVCPAMPSAGGARPSRGRWGGGGGGGAPGDPRPPQGRPAQGWGRLVDRWRGGERANRRWVSAEHLGRRRETVPFPDVVLVAEDHDV